MIAHNAAWKQRAAIILSCAARGQPPPAFDDEDRLNVETFEANRERPWRQVLADAKATLLGLLAQGRPLGLLAYSNAFSHPQWHLGLWRLTRGDLAGATQIHERLAETQRRLDDSPQSCAAGAYNLACFYSLSGQRDRALAALAAALKFKPDLVELSKTDADLDALRGDAAFQALVEAIEPAQ